MKCEVSQCLNGVKCEVCQCLNGVKCEVCQCLNGVKCEVCQCLNGVKCRRNPRVLLSELHGHGLHTSATRVGGWVRLCQTPTTSSSHLSFQLVFSLSSFISHPPVLLSPSLIIIIIINLIYIAQFDTNGILLALYIVITYIQMQYVHV